MYRLKSSNRKSHVTDRASSHVGEVGQVFCHRICIGWHVAVRVEVLGDRKMSFLLVKVLNAHNKGERANRQVAPRWWPPYGKFPLLFLCH